MSDTCSVFPPLGEPVALRMVLLKLPQLRINWVSCGIPLWHCKKTDLCLSQCENFMFVSLTEMVFQVKEQNTSSLVTSQICSM